MKSTCTTVGAVQFPEFKGVRVMMMPFLIEDPVGSLPQHLQEYAKIVRSLPNWGRTGVGYLTVDEAMLRIGEHHRRPGLHVDGHPRHGGGGGWGGSGGGWAKRGMIIAATKPGCVVYAGDFQGTPDDDGCVEHIRGQLTQGYSLRPSTAYWMSPEAVHETIPQTEAGPRQWLRISMPSDAPWYEGYTPNPLGIMPGGPILPPRTKQMAYRP